MHLSQSNHDDQNESQVSADYIKGIAYMGWDRARNHPQSGVVDFTERCWQSGGNPGTIFNPRFMECEASFVSSLTFIKHLIPLILTVTDSI